ncbi:MAG: hypothetical protein IPK19_04185 [Chloroflexi bacterium]|nr:hypothetical protein [Chloroflexota bacterium]
MIWLKNGETFTRRGGQFNARAALAWSPDGQHLAASNGVREVRMVNRDGLLVALLPGQANTLAWTPDGSALATGSNDGMVRLWPAAPLT